jgi:hypothetical protein
MMLRPARALVASILISVAGLPFSVSSAEDLQTQEAQKAQKAALSMIVETANEICQSAPLEATSQGMNLSGNATAKLGGLIGKVADLGVTGAGEYQTSHSMGVLQKDLITAIQSGNNCKLEVFRALRKELLSGVIAPQGNSSTTSPPAPAPAPQAPIITTTVPAPAPVPKQSSLWNHNGSVMYLVANGNSREFYYQQPRPGMVQAGAHPGALLFKGEHRNGQYAGTAYIFNRSCGQFPYEVSGPILDGYRRVVMYGNAPRVNQDCQIFGVVPDTLEFTLMP